MASVPELTDSQNVSCSPDKSRQQKLLESLPKLLQYLFLQYLAIPRPTGDSNAAGLSCYVDVCYVKTAKPDTAQNQDKNALTEIKMICHGASEQGSG